MNLYDLATFSITKTYQLVTIFVSLNLMAAKNRHKIRFWDDSYVQYGFTKVIGCDKLNNAQCTLCNTILGNDSLKPSKLKRHKELKHKENTDSVEMFKAKRTPYDAKGTLPVLGFCRTSEPLLRTSYEVSLIIAKAKAPHTAGEKLIKPNAVKMKQILMGRNETKRIDSVPLSVDTATAPIKRRFDVVVRPPTSFGLSQNGCRTFRGSQLPPALPFILSLCCPLNDCRRAAHSFLKIGRLFSYLLPFSCPTSSPSSLDEQ